MICIAWSGLPVYAARCLEHFVQTVADTVVIITTMPDVPICGPEKILSCPVYFVKDDDARSIVETVGSSPDVFVQSGWFVPCFNRWGEDVRRAGGTVIAMVDNNFRPSAKEVLKRIRFRLLIKKRYRCFFVAGESGRRLLLYYGVAEHLIRKGLYAADKKFFNSGRPLSERPKKFLFVGRFDDRKNVLRICEAFLIFSKKYPDWCLDLYGCGPLVNSIPSNPSIAVHDFVQQDELPQIYQSARCFILGSLEEHWGVVVHEATLSGCMLLLSRAVGAAEDLANMKNAFLFAPKHREEIALGMEQVALMTNRELDLAQQESLRLAAAFSTKSFADNLLQLVSISKEGL